MVRVAPEQLPDTVRFPVGQTEGAVQRGWAATSDR